MPPMRAHVVPSALITLVTAMPSVVAQAPQILVDINTIGVTELSSDPGSFCVLGTQVLFAATTGALGRELYRFDTATGATNLVLDIRPGATGSAPTQLVAFGGQVWFVADDGVRGAELWRTDGTAAGTVLVRDVVPGVANGSLRELTVVGGQLFFAATTPNEGAELWVSDGTSAGTRLAADAVPGGGSSFPTGLTAFGNQVAFRAIRPGFGSEPCISDGTAAGTTILADVVPGSGGSFPRAFAVVGGALLFGTATSLFRSDGTAVGTSNLGGPSPLRMKSLGATAFYDTGTSVYSTDGTAANTTLVASTAGPGEQNVHLDVVGGTAIVFVNPIASGSSRVVACDAATGAQTLLSQSIPLLPETASAGGRLWFGALSINQSLLWQTDGTAAGTVPLTGLHPSSAVAPTAITAIPGNRLCFSGLHPTFGREPFVSDGTAAGTRILANVGVSAGPNQPSRAGHFAAIGGITYFAASDDGQGTTLWRTDGTPAGTWVVVPPGPAQPREVESIVAQGTRIFFSASTAALGNEVWVSDGTAAGTFVPFDIAPGSDGSGPTGLTAAADGIFFTAFSTVISGRGLWFSAGTFLTTHALTFNGSVYNSPVVAFGKGVLTSRYEPGRGFEPYYASRSNAVSLGELAPGAFDSDPGFFTVLGDRCYFLANQGAAIWVTDGTPAGTQVFLDLLPNADENFNWLHRVGDRLFFAVNDGVHGYELWSSDGTVAGSQLASDMSPGLFGTHILPYGSIGDVCLFVARPSGSSQDLWRSDGTPAGTFLLAPNYGNFHVVDDGRYAWLQHVDATSGRELWRTDGTVAGTALFADLNPGSANGDPVDFVVAGGRLLFGAVHPTQGLEPWVLPLGASVQPVGEACFTTGTAPRLQASAPVLGTTMTVRGSNGPTAGLAGTLYSFPADAPFRLPGGSCDLWLAPQFEVLQFSVLTAGGFSLSLSLPGDPVFQGLQLQVQSLLFPNATLVGVEATPAVRLGFGL